MLRMSDSLEPTDQQGAQDENSGDDASKPIADHLYLDSSEIESIKPKKRKVGEVLGEIFNEADTLRVCPFCWAGRGIQIHCPRAAEQTTSIRAYLHLQSGGDPPTAIS